MEFAEEAQPIEACSIPEMAPRPYLQARSGRKSNEIAYGQTTLSDITVYHSTAQDKKLALYLKTYLHLLSSTPIDTETMSQSIPQVDRTKPSTACEPCRKRRSKCDRKRPACSQCIRKSRNCIGYREDLDLVLRNESDKVQLRLVNKQDAVVKSKGASPTTSGCVTARSTGSGQASPETGFEQYNEMTVTTDGQSSRLLAVPRQSDSIVATNLFLSSFAQGVYLDYLPELYGGNGPSQILQVSFEAVALSYLAKVKNSATLTRQALRKYSSALRKTTQALSTLPKAMEDDTIAAVMLLSIFGVFSFDPVQAMETWTEHINGAMALLNIRPRNSFVSVKSQLLLNHVVSSVHLNCMQQRRSLPAQLPRLYELSQLAQGTFQAQFWNLTEAVAALRESVAKNSIEPFNAVEQAVRLEFQATTLFNALPVTQEQFIHRPGARYNSQDNRIIQARSTLRMVRIELNKVVIGCGGLCLVTNVDLDSSSRSFLTAQVQHAETSIELVATDICNSIPEFLFADCSVTSWTKNTTVWICGFFLPLTVALNSNLLSPALDQRIRQQLKRFSEICENPNMSNLMSGTSDTEMLQMSACALYLC